MEPQLRGTEAVLPGGGEGWDTECRGRGGQAAHIHLTAPSCSSQPAGSTPPRGLGESHTQQSSQGAGEGAAATAEKSRPPETGRRTAGRTPTRPWVLCAAQPGPTAWSHVHFGVRGDARQTPWGRWRAHLGSPHLGGAGKGNPQ